MTTIETVNKTVSEKFNNVTLLGNKVTKLVTYDELSTILDETTYIKGATVIASIIQLTEPKLTKKDRDTKIEFNKNVQKLSKVSILLNTDYVNGIELQKNREIKAGLDTDKHEKGKNTMPLILSDNNVFFGHFNKKAVLQYRPNTNIKNIAKSQYFLDGAPIEKNDLPNVLPTSYTPKNQGNAKVIFWRKLYVTNIIEITINKINYKLIR